MISKRLNHRGILKAIFGLSLSVGLSVTLTACMGAGFETPEQSFESGQTGDAKIITNPVSGEIRRVPYTGSKNTQELEQQKKIMTPKDITLSQSIGDVNLYFVDDFGNRTLSAKNRVVVQLEIKNGAAINALKFDGEFSPVKAKSRHLNLIRGEGFNATVACKNSNCESLSLVLTRLSDQSKASITYRQSVAHIRLAKQKVPVQNKSLETLFTAVKENRPVQKTSVVIANGPSFTKLSIYEDSKNQTDKVVNDNEVLSIRSDLLQTTDEVSPVQEIKVKGIRDEKVDANLVGNNPETADLAFDINLKTETSSTDSEPESIRVYIDESKPSKPVDPTNAPCAESTSSAFSDQAFIKVDFKNANLANSIRTACQIEAYKKHREVQKHIRVWRGIENLVSCQSKNKNGHGMGSLTPRFFKYMSPYKKQLAKIYNRLDVTPNVTYLMAVESQYPFGGYDPVVTTGASNSTAAGPFQITGTLAEDLRGRFGLDFVTYPLTGQFPKRKLKPNDHRNYLGPSATAAAIYSRRIIDLYPEDPGLWPLSYNQGQGATAKFQKCASLKTEEERNKCRKSSSISSAFKERNAYVNVTLDDIDRYNMAPCDSIQYSYRVLAFSLIASDPQAFGISISKEDENLDAPAFWPNDSVASDFSKVNPRL